MFWQISQTRKVADPKCLLHLLSFSISELIEHGREVRHLEVVGDRGHVLLVFVVGLVTEFCCFAWGFCFVDLTDLVAKILLVLVAFSDN